MDNIFCYDAMWNKKTDSYDAEEPLCFVSNSHRSSDVFNSHWFNENWIHRVTWTLWDEKWFDIYWIHKTTKLWYDEYWYDINWYDKLWLNEKWEFMFKPTKILSQEERINFVENLKSRWIKTLRYFFYWEETKIKSILSRWIYAQNFLTLKDIWTDVSKRTVQEKRHLKMIWNINVHDFVPLYMTAKTPTFWDHKCSEEYKINDFIFIAFSIDILKQKNIKFAYSDWNVWSETTKIYTDVCNIDKIPFNTLNAETRNSDNKIVKKENKRKRCSEILIYGKIDCKYIWAFWRIFSIIWYKDSELKHEIKIKFWNDYLREEYKQKKLAYFENRNNMTCFIR